MVYYTRCLLAVFDAKFIKNKFEAACPGSLHSDTRTFVVAC